MAAMCTDPNEIHTAAHPTPMQHAEYKSAFVLRTQGTSVKLHSGHNTRPHVVPVRPRTDALPQIDQRKRSVREKPYQRELPMQSDMLHGVTLFVLPTETHKGLRLRVSVRNENDFPVRVRLYGRYADSVAANEESFFNLSMADCNEQAGTGHDTNANRVPLQLLCSTMIVPALQKVAVGKCFAKGNRGVAVAWAWSRHGEARRESQTTESVFEGVRLIKTVFHEVAGTYCACFSSSNISTCQRSVTLTPSRVDYIGLTCTGDVCT